jgi:hypothetical protein
MKLRFYPDNQRPDFTQEKNLINQAKLNKILLMLDSHLRNIDPFIHHIFCIEIQYPEKTFTIMNYLHYPLDQFCIARFAAQSFRS